MPPPQTIQNKDGTKTTITYRFDEDGKKVKTTRRIRMVTHREVVNPRVAERKVLPKFGLSEKDPKGPQMDTTSVGENIIFRLSPNWKRDAKDESKDANANAMKEKLKDKTVKCRICNGEHFTARCPYKDTMAPVGAETADPAAGLADEDTASAAAGGAGAGKKGSYVPPALRGGPGGAAAGERMGGSKYGERDDLATLRVTNVSSILLLPHLVTTRCATDILTPSTTGFRDGRRSRASGYVRALRSCHSCVLGQGSRYRYGQGLRLHQLRRQDGRGQGMQQDGRLWFQAFDSARRVRQEGSHVKGQQWWRMSILLAIYSNIRFLNENWVLRKMVQWDTQVRLHIAVMAYDFRPAYMSMKEMPSSNANLGFVY